MRKVSLFLILSLCSACMPHSKPAANIEFYGVTSKERIFPPLQEGGEPTKLREFTISFTSDIEMLELFKKEDGDNPLVWARLVCTLDDDTNFSVKHNLRRYARGEVELTKIGGKVQDDDYLYAFKLNFYEENDGEGRSSLKNKELNRLLSGRHGIPCKVVMTVYLSAPYYSNTMYVPVKDLLREVNRQ